MMDHEINDGKLCLKENDLVLYENRDESKNYQSVVRLIFMIILITVVSVILLRKIFGTQRRKLFRFMYICLFLPSPSLLINELDITTSLLCYLRRCVENKLFVSILYFSIVGFLHPTWISINLTLLYSSRMR